MDLCNLKGMYRVNSSEMQVVTEPLKVLKPNEILKWTPKKHEDQWQGARMWEMTEACE